MNKIEFDWVNDELAKRDKRMDYIVNTLIENINKRLVNLEKELFGKKIKASELKNGDANGDE